STLKGCCARAVHSKGAIFWGIAESGDAKVVFGPLRRGMQWMRRRRSGARPRCNVGEREATRETGGGPPRPGAKKDTVRSRSRRERPFEDSLITLRLAAAHVIAKWLPCCFKAQYVAP